MRTKASEKTRILLVRGNPGDILPDSLEGALRTGGVTCGWVRAGGILEDVVLRGYGAGRGPAEPRRFAGPLQAIVLEGGVGLANGAPSVGLRAVLAREGDRGLETIAGELVSAKVVGLEAVVTATDDVAWGRAHDATTGTWLLHDPSTNAAREPATPSPGKDVAWADAAAASAEAEREAPKRSATASASAQGAATVGGSVLPPRPIRPAPSLDDLPFPEAGDRVEHFAFGPCEVLKSDGDRLHVRVGKDGRIKEIALEMLRVTPLGEFTPSDPPPDGERRVVRRYKLDRKL